MRMNNNVFRLYLLGVMMCVAGISLTGCHRNEQNGNIQQARWFALE